MRSIPTIIAGLCLLVLTALQAQATEFITFVRTCELRVDSRLITNTTLQHTAITVAAKRIVSEEKGLNLHLMFLRSFGRSHYVEFSFCVAAEQAFKVDAGTPQQARAIALGQAYVPGGNINVDVYVIQALTDLLDN